MSKLNKLPKTKTAAEAVFEAHPEIVKRSLNFGHLPLRLFRSSVVEFYTEDVKSEKLRIAAESALILLSTLEDVPPEAINWLNIKAVLEALAQAA